MAYTTIDDPTQFFNTLLYTGNAADGSSTTQDITGVGFQPDWVWLKSRTQANHHFLVDSVRGANKGLYSDLTNTENTSTDYLKSFASDGFQVGPDGVVNANSQSYVSWNWLAGGSGSSNTNGTITSTVSANTTAGFSIVKWTGNATSSQSVGHGLGAVPKVILTKNTDNGSQPWKCYFEQVGNAKYLQLNATDTPATSGVWSSTTPTSSIISISNDTGINGSGNDIIAYCFAEKQGFSKFGSYTGNGNADGPFVYLGFRPAWVMTKRTDSSTNGHWSIFDTKRNTHNVNDLPLRANSSDAQSSIGNYAFDILSNGFKPRGTNTTNDSGGTFIYMAFAEAPFVNSNGVPTNAR